MINELKRVHVAVGVICGTDGRILVTQRSQNQHLGGMWEFPGGKLEPGETVNEALSRELFEELSIRPVSQLPLCRIVHNYPDKAVLLDVWMVTQFSGDPSPQEGQPLRWLSLGQLNADDFPQANKAIIRYLKLPDFFAIFQVTATHNSQYKQATGLRCVISSAPHSSLIRLRHSGTVSSYQVHSKKLIREHADVCLNNNLGFVVDLPNHRPLTMDHFLDSHELGKFIRGYHANSTTLSQLHSRPVADHLLFGASCHSIQDIRKAETLQADYIFLSPIKATPSHPDAKPLGWPGLNKISESTQMAIYALGGMALTDLPIAHINGARGIAGISMFGQN